MARAAVAFLVALALLLGGCASSNRAEVETDWSPAPVVAGDLTMVATAGPAGFALHTASGAKTFLPGVNLGSTTPNHQPGELAIGAEDYRRWFAAMGDLGVRLVRVYTIHPPAFYTELADYNAEHPAAPLYLAQGVYLPDETYLDGGTLYDEVTDASFARELIDVSAAVHGELARGPTTAAADGTWTADVSAWLASWIVGVELDPEVVARTDAQHADVADVAGRYFASARGASATERWLARHMDSLAELEAARGTAAPIAFVNWPTTDPLSHPDEPSEYEDRVGIDANRVRPTANWPAGTFASYHAYPYYPDFLRHEESLSETTWQGQPDPYAGYLSALHAHHAEMPVMITEVGVPSSLGSAHLGTNGRDQGGHSERAAMAIDAELLRIAHAQGMAGGYVFAWTDEWFKRTWNTMNHQWPADRRQLWHDPLTNEQHFGLVATEPDRVAGAQRTVDGAGVIGQLSLDADASYVFVDVDLAEDLPAALRVEADVVEGGDADYRVDLDLVARTAQVWVRAGLDPIRLDNVAGYGTPAGGVAGWHPYRLVLNRPQTLHGVELPAEFQDVGALVEGAWDPSAEGFDSRATWQVVQASDGATVRLRLPWPMVGMADPSSLTALGEGVPAQTPTVDGIALTVSVGDDVVDAWLDWEPWQGIGYTERIKDGVAELAAVFAELAP